MARLLVEETYSFDVERPYIRQSCQNRTKIRLPDRCHWLTVPVKKREKGTPLSEIEIDYNYPWLQDHLKGLKYNYATAPYYDHFIPSLSQLLQKEFELLHELTTETVNWAVQVGGLNTRFQGDASILKGSNAHLNSHEPSESHTIRTQQNGPAVIQPYRQNFPGFHPGAGILDLLFNHGPAAVTYLG